MTKTLISATLKGKTVAVLGFGSQAMPMLSTSAIPA